MGDQALQNQKDPASQSVLSSPELTKQYSSILGNGFLDDSDTEDADPSKQSATDPADKPGACTERRIELKRLFQYPTEKYSDRVEVVPADSYRTRRKAPDPNNPYKNYSILFRRVLSFMGRTEEIRLEIQSEELCNFLQNIGKPYRSLANFEARPIKMRKPFRALFFLKDALEASSGDKSLDENLKKEIELLVEFIHSPEGLQAPLTAYEEQVKLGKVTYGLLWALFPPQTVVYFNDGTDEECAVVESTEYSQDGLQRPSFELTAIQGYHTGDDFGVSRIVYEVPFFSTLLDITCDNLVVIPLKSLPKERQNEVRQRLIARGKRYCEMHSATCTHLAYNGPFWAFDADSVFQKRIERSKHVQINGRVVVDTRAILRLGLWKPRDLIATSLTKHLKRQMDGPSDDEDSESGDDRDHGSTDDDARFDELHVPGTSQEPEVSEEQRSDEEYLICPTYIRCFFLQVQEWGIVLIENLQDIEWDPDAFRQLQLADSTKDDLEALVKGFDPEAQTGFDDAIQGKGKGLIFLLHGEPGLGKTMTAESIAEYAQIPLYHVTTGQLSTNVSQMEVTLRNIFMLGHRWKALVLIDEADVLMSQRTLRELDRNAIVAVFLRLIEYYGGILFLTTNRLEGFDKAFYNRIHVKIKYPNLDCNARSNIWRNLLTRSRNHPTLDDSWSEEIYPVLGELQTNGRDIKNMIRIAYGLASYGDTDAVSVGHVLKAIGINSSVDSPEKVQEIEALSKRIYSLVEKKRGRDGKPTTDEKQGLTVGDRGEEC